MGKLNKKEKRRWKKKLEKLKAAWLEAKTGKKTIKKKYRKAWKKLAAKLKPLKAEWKAAHKEAKKRHKAYKKARKAWKRLRQPEAQPEVVITMSAPPPDPGMKDILRKIEGIGPKIEQLLYDAGITTFTRLATTQPEAIKEILINAGPRFRMHNPGSWPAQAQLAADKNWEELKALQDRLKGGRE
ncbi:MAG: 50S ribosomal protein L21 [Bacteroidota bacterium]